MICSFFSDLADVADDAAESFLRMLLTVALLTYEYVGAWLQNGADGVVAVADAVRRLKVVLSTVGLVSMGDRGDWQLVGLAREQIEAVLRLRRGVDAVVMKEAVLMLRASLGLADRSMLARKMCEAMM